MSSLNGVLPVDKPVGPTSHDVVSIARRGLGVRRIGHTGTLDPFASGLLLLCVGPATRLAEYLTGLSKSYSATLRLGIVTETDDHQGSTIRTSEAWADITLDRLEEALASQRGTILQMPPRFSAKKVGGKRMYDVARAGGEVNVEPSQVTITRLEVRRFEPPEVDIEVDCSSGTYIRAIARDLGERLGVGAHLTALRRTRIGRHHIADAIPVDQIGEVAVSGAALMPPAAAVADLPNVVVPEAEMRSLQHGSDIPAPPGTPEGAPLALLSAGGELLAIGELRGDRIQPRKVFT